MATIKKAQAGVKLSPQQKRAQMDSVASVKRAEIVRKKDSILNRQAAAKGMTREQQRAQQLAERCSKQTDASLLSWPLRAIKHVGIVARAVRETYR